MTTRVLLSIVLGLALVLGCGGEHRAARDTYNRGVAALANGELEDAEKLLLEARSQAGLDPTLRFHAAYDLGVAYAAHADKVKAGAEPDLAQALALAQQALSWFNDAARLRKDDASTQANLAVMRARVQAISDELRAGEGKLEARLDQLITDERDVLDEARAAWAQIQASGGTDPLAQQGPLTRLADRERGIVAEAGVVADLAADEIDAIGKKPEDQRTDEEKVRVVVLKNVDLYLLEARTRIAEARHKLQELAAEDGVGRAEAALVALKRAREQLLDPVTVLRGVAQEQVALAQETAYTGAATGAVKLDLAGPAPTPEQLPAWLAAPQIAARQGTLRDRLLEVQARMQAGVEAGAAPVSPAPPGAPAPAGAPAPDPAQAKLLARVRAALPAVGEASAAMERARAALAEPRLAVAALEERAALEALARAIEQFADLKQTIELAYADQKQLVSLLAPEAETQLPADKRATETRDALARNLARMPRLKELIADEVTALEAKAESSGAAAQPAQPAQMPGAGSGSAGAPDPAQQAAEQLAQNKQRLTRAEELRGQAQAALDQLGTALARGPDPRVPAADGEAKLAELRRLFFSVIEHLQQLIRDQGETRDQTTTVDGMDPFGREAKLPGVIGRQTGHGEMATAITDALAAQADAAAQQKGPPQQGAPDPKALSAAAAEVRLAQGEMSDADRVLARARDATTTSERLVPATESQARAIEHLEAALRLLQPPPKQDPKPQDQKQQDPKQPGEQDKDKKQEPQPAGGASQRAKDMDASRQKERRQREQAADPVEQDW